jgi:hypothetical protein
MTLLSIVQRVADEVGIPRPAAVASDTGQLARQMFALANATLEDLGKDDWHGLQSMHIFTTVNGTSTYNAPADYKRLVNGGAFNTDSGYQLNGSLTPEAYWRIANNMVLAGGRFKFRMVGRTISITPTPTVEEDLSFLYVSSYLALSSAAAAKSLFSLDDDDPAMPEELVVMGLKWRMKHAKGLEYGEDYNAYQERRKTLMAQELSLGAIPVAVRRGYDDTEVNVPTSGFG